MGEKKKTLVCRCSVFPQASLNAASQHKRRWQVASTICVSATCCRCRSPGATQRTATSVIWNSTPSRQTSHTWLPLLTSVPERRPAALLFWLSPFATSVTLRFAITNSDALTAPLKGHMQPQSHILNKYTIYNSTPTNRQRCRFAQGG